MPDDLPGSQSGLEKDPAEDLQLLASDLGVRSLDQLAAGGQPSSASRCQLRQQIHPSTNQQ